MTIGLRISALAVLSFAACAPGRVINAPPASHATSGSLAATNVTITIPSARTSSSAMRRAMYVSSATNSMVISPQGQPSIVVPLTANSPGCSTTSGGRQCAVALNLAAGTYAIGVALYPTSNGTGAPLAISTAVQTIATNALNKLSFTLNAVLTKIAIAVAPDATFLLGVPGNRVVNVSALDPANATIVVGNDALVDQSFSPVSIRLAVSDTSGALSIAPNVAGTTPSTLFYNGAMPNNMAVGATAANASNATVASDSAHVQVGSGAAALTPTVSRYVATMDHTQFFQEGQTMGGQGQSGLVILDFGQPWFCDNLAPISCSPQDKDKFGTFDYEPGQPFRSTDDILLAAEAFADGWWSGHHNDYRMQLRLAIGTSNLCAPVRNDCNRIQFSSHGAAWGGMVQALATYVRQRGYSNQIAAAGASDIELSYNAPALTAQWVTGFNSVRLNGIAPTLYNYGSASGCPRDSLQGFDGACDHGWRQSDVLNVSWQGRAIPVPEIYCNPGTENEWYQLSLASIRMGFGPIAFGGVLTDHSAAGQRTPLPGDCVPTNRPADALQLLQAALNKDPATRDPSLVYATDLTYSIGTPTPLGRHPRSSGE